MMIMKEEENKYGSLFSSFTLQIAIKALQIYSRTNFSRNQQEALKSLVDLFHRG